LISRRNFRKRTGTATAKARRHYPGCFGLSRVREFSLQRHAMVSGRRPDEFPEQNQILHLFGAEVFDLITNIAIGGIGSMLKANRG
jgi:hypothetical protein